MDTDMICLGCEGEKFTCVHTTFDFEINGAPIEVWAYAFACDHCGELLMTTGQMQLLLDKVKYIKIGVMVNELPENKQLI